MAPITTCHTKIECTSQCVIVNFVELSSALQMYRRWIYDRTDLQYLVIGCTATLWCALKPACQNPVRASLHSKWEENIFLFVRSKPAGGHEPFFPAACWLHRQMDVTDPSQWSQQRLKQGHSHFPDHGCPLSSPGVQFISICRSVKPASAGPPSLTLGRTAGGLADLLVWELTTLAAQSANTAEFKQLKPAGMAVRDAPQDQTVARREIVSSPTPWQSVSMAAWVCIQSEWRTSSQVLTFTSECLCSASEFCNGVMSWVSWFWSKPCG